MAEHSTITNHATMKRAPPRPPLDGIYVLRTSRPTLPGAAPTCCGCCPCIRHVEPALPPIMFYDNEKSAVAVKTPPTG